ncbi:hypothetical protein IOR84_000097 [Escherichia coli]|nr:hypothetical protein [Escherichia coli]
MIKDLVASGHALADDMTGAPSVLVRCLAAQLDVQLVRANELAEDHQKAIESIKQADAAVKLAHEKFSALAAENAALKKFCKDAAFDADYEAELGMERGGFSDALNDIETTATDAFLAEVRAQGVEMARNAMIDFVDGEIGPNKNVPGLIRGAEICVSIAEQLRKGGNQ